MKTSLMIPALLVMVQGPPASSPIVQTAKGVMQELSREGGTEIRVSPGLAGALLLVVRHGCPPRQTAASVARALHASLLSLPGGGLVIERTAADVVGFNERRTVERAGWIHKRMEELAKYRSTHGGDGPRNSQLFSEILRQGRGTEKLARGKADEPVTIFATELLPVQSLLADLVSVIGEKVLASTPSDVTRVWEDDPVGNSERLPPHDRPVERFLAASGKFAQPDLPEDVRRQLPLLGMKEFFEQWGKPVERPTKLRLAERTEDGMITLVLTGYDARGNQVLFAAEAFSPGEFFRFPSTIAKPFMTDSKSAWMKLSGEQSSSATFHRITTLAGLPDWFRHPDKNEPMNVAVAQALAALAEREPRKCFVANVPDSLWRALQASTDGDRLNLDAFQAVFEEWSSMERVKDDEAVVWRPRETLDDLGHQADRRALASLINATAASGELGLRQVANFALRASDRQTDLTNLWLWTLQSSPAIRQTSWSARYEFYRLLGAIPDEAWDVLRQGRSMTVAQAGIGPELATLIADEYETPVRGDAPIPALYTHPSELYDRGGEGGEPIRLFLRTGEYIRVGQNGNEGNDHWSDARFPGGLGKVPSRLAPTPHVSVTRAQYEDNLKRRGTKVCFGIREDIVITIGLPKGLYFREDFPGVVVPRSELMPYEDVPENVRASIWKNLCAEALDRYNHPVSTTPTRPQFPPPLP